MKYTLRSKYILHGAQSHYSSENVATMQHSTSSSGPSGSSRSQMLSSSLSGGSDWYSIPIASRLKAALLPSKLFRLRKLRGAWPEFSGPAWGKGTEGRYPFCASRRYGGVGAGALCNETVENAFAKSLVSLFRSLHLVCTARSPKSRNHELSDLKVTLIHA